MVGDGWLVAGDGWLWLVMVGCGELFELYELNWNDSLVVS